MRWPIGVPQEIHIDTMGSNKEDEMCVIPFTDYASILYLNDDFDDGLTIFEGGYEIKPQQGMVAIFEGMKYWHEVSACKGKDRYTLPCWYTTEWKNMELQSQKPRVFTGRKMIKRTLKGIYRNRKKIKKCKKKSKEK